MGGLLEAALRRPGSGIGLPRPLYPRVAISNDRLVRLEDGKVTFRWKDYRKGNKQKLMTLDAEEFIRRFLLHVLPRSFVRIRHFGFLANSRSKSKLARCRELLGVPQADPQQSSASADWRASYEKLTGESLTICPACREGHMVMVAILPRQNYPLPSGSIRHDYEGLRSH